MNATGSRQAFAIQSGKLTPCLCPLGFRRFPPLLLALRLLRLDCGDAFFLLLASLFGAQLLFRQPGLFFRFSPLLLLLLLALRFRRLDCGGALFLLLASLFGAQLLLRQPSLLRAELVRPSPEARLLCLLP